MTTFKEQILSYLKENNIPVTKVETADNELSIICHISPSDNDKIETLTIDAEKQLNANIMISSDIPPFNVIIFEKDDYQLTT